MNLPVNSRRGQRRRDQEKSAMSNFNQESVTSVHHWTDNLFSFTTTRDPSFRFRNGEFTMIGLKVGEKPLLRAYSVASANYEDQLEFFSIKVQDGPLTSKLQHLKVGDPIIVSRKATGTLVIDNLESGRNLYLVGTGTGLAPFLSVIKDPETFDRFEKVVLLHGCRRVKELAYGEMITDKLPKDELIGDYIHLLPDRDARPLPQSWTHHRPHHLGQAVRGYRSARDRAGA
jgi:ferredoxin--NADP+ reductase